MKVNPRWTVLHIGSLPCLYEEKSIPLHFPSSNQMKRRTYRIIISLGAVSDRLIFHEFSIQSVPSNIYPPSVDSFSSPRWIYDIRLCQRGLFRLKSSITGKEDLIPPHGRKSRGFSNIEEGNSMFVSVNPRWSRLRETLWILLCKELRILHYLYLFSLNNVHVIDVVWKAGIVLNVRHFWTKYEISVLF